ncbi:MAG: ATP-binding protein [Candidatus Hodarchaeales archaeon]
MSEHPEEEQTENIVDRESEKENNTDRQEDALWVGWDDANNEITIDSQKLNRHMAVLGSTGSGKTVLCKAVVEEAIIAGIPIIAVDPQGDITRLGMMEDRTVLEDKNIPTDLARNYESRAGIAIFTPGTKDGIKIIVDPVKSLPKPEDKGKLSESKVLRVLAGIGGTIVSLLTTPSKQKRGFIEHIIFKSLEIAYKEGEEIPSMRAFFNYLKSDATKSKLNDTVSSAIMKSYNDMLAELEMILEGPTGTLFRDGVPLDLDLLLEEKNGKVPLNIFYLNTLEDENLKQFFLAYLGNEIYSYMMRKGKINALFFIDEVKIFLPPGIQKTLSKSILLSLLEQGRKYGLKMLMATQSPGKIDYQAFGQCNTRAYGILSTKQDLDKVKDSVPDHVKDALPRLASGNFFLQDPKGDFQRLKVRWLYTDHGEPIPAQQLRDIMLDETIEYYQRVIDDAKAVEGTAVSFETETAEITSDTREAGKSTEIPELPEISGPSASVELEISPADVSDQKITPSVKARVIPVSPDLFHDLLYLVNILIIHKRSGICVLDKPTGLMTTDPQLVAGFLHALMTWMKEISPQEREYGQRMQLKKFSKEGFTIWVVDGNFTAFALIMKHEPKQAKDIRIRMQQFVIAFEKSYNKELEDFLGDMSVFDVDHVDELLERTLGISLLYPFQLEHEKTSEGALKDFKKEVIDFIKEKEGTFLSDDEGVFLEELLKHGVNELGTISRRRAIITLLDLVESKVLVPVFGFVWFKEEIETKEKVVEEKHVEEETVFIPITEKEEELARLPDLSDLPVKEQEADESLPKPPISTPGDHSLVEPLVIEPVDQPLPEDEISPDLEVEKDIIDSTEIPGWVNYQAEQIRNMPVTSAPARIADDILKREIVYAGKGTYRAIERTMKRIDATMSNIDEHVALIASKGYIIEKQVKNSLKGITYLFENEKTGHKIVFATVKLDSNDILVLLFDSQS